MSRRRHASREESSRPVREPLPDEPRCPDLTEDELVAFKACHRLQTLDGRWDPRLGEYADGLSPREIEVLDFFREQFTAELVYAGSVRAILDLGYTIEAEDGFHVLENAEALLAALNEALGPPES